MIGKTSALYALALIAVLAAPAFALADETGQGAPAVQQDEAGDDDPLDRWQREDDADHLEERREQRQEQREQRQEQRLDKQFDEQAGQPEPE